MDALSLLLNDAVAVEPVVEWLETISCLPHNQRPTLTLNCTIEAKSFATPSFAHTQSLESPQPPNSSFDTRIIEVSCAELLDAVCTYVDISATHVASLPLLELLEMNDPTLARNTGSHVSFTSSTPTKARSRHLLRLAAAAAPCSGHHRTDMPAPFPVPLTALSSGPPRAAGGCSEIFVLPPASTAGLQPTDTSVDVCACNAHINTASCLLCVLAAQSRSVVAEPHSRSPLQSQGDQGSTELGAADEGAGGAEVDQPPGESVMSDVIGAVAGEASAVCGGYGYCRSLRCRKVTTNTANKFYELQAYPVHVLSLLLSVAARHALIPTHTVLKWALRMLATVPPPSRTHTPLITAATLGPTPDFWELCPNYSFFPIIIPENVFIPPIFLNSFPVLAAVASHTLAHMLSALVRLSCSPLHRIILAYRAYLPARSVAYLATWLCVAQRVRASAVCALAPSPAATATGKGDAGARTAPEGHYDFLPQSDILSDSAFLPPIALSDKPNDIPPVLGVRELSASSCGASAGNHELLAQLLQNPGKVLDTLHVAVFPPPSPGKAPSTCMLASEDLKIPDSEDIMESDMLATGISSTFDPEFSISGAHALVSHTMRRMYDAHSNPLPFTASTATTPGMRDILGIPMTPGFPHNSPYFGDQVFPEWTQSFPDTPRGPPSPSPAPPRALHQSHTPPSRAIPHLRAPAHGTHATPDHGYPSVLKSTHSSVNTGSGASDGDGVGDAPRTPVRRDARRLVRTPYTPHAPGTPFPPLTPYSPFPAHYTTPHGVFAHGTHRTAPLPLFCSLATVPPCAAGPSSIGHAYGHADDDASRRVITHSSNDADASVGLCLCRAAEVPVPLWTTSRALLTRSASQLRQSHWDVLAYDGAPMWALVDRVSPHKTADAGARAASVSASSAGLACVVAPVATWALQGCAPVATLDATSASSPDPMSTVDSCLEAIGADDAASVVNLFLSAATASDNIPIVPERGPPSVSVTAAWPTVSTSPSSTPVSAPVASPAARLSLMDPAELSGALASLDGAQLGLEQVLETMHPIAVAARSDPKVQLLRDGEAIHGDTSLGGVTELSSEAMPVSDLSVLAAPHTLASSPPYSHLPSPSARGHRTAPVQSLLTTANPVVATPGLGSGDCLAERSSEFSRAQAAILGNSDESGDAGGVGCGVDGAAGGTNILSTASPTVVHDNTVESLEKHTFFGKTNISADSPNPNPVPSAQQFSNRQQVADWLGGLCTAYTAALQQRKVRPSDWPLVALFSSCLAVDAPSGTPGSLLVNGAGAVSSSRTTHGKEDDGSARVHTLALTTPAKPRSFAAPASTPRTRTPMSPCPSSSLSSPLPSATPPDERMRFHQTLHARLAAFFAATVHAAPRPQLASSSQCLSPTHPAPANTLTATARAMPSHETRVGSVGAGHVSPAPNTVGPCSGSEDPQQHLFLTPPRPHNRLHTQRHAHTALGGTAVSGLSASLPTASQLPMHSTANTPANAAGSAGGDTSKSPFAPDTLLPAPKTAAARGGTDMATPNPAPLARSLSSAASTAPTSASKGGSQAHASAHGVSATGGLLGPSADATQQLLALPSVVLLPENTRWFARCVVNTLLRLCWRDGLDSHEDEDTEGEDAESAGEDRSNPSGVSGDTDDIGACGDGTAFTPREYQQRWALSRASPRLPHSTSIPRACNRSSLRGVFRRFRGLQGLFLRMVLWFVFPPSTAKTETSLSCDTVGNTMSSATHIHETDTTQLPPPNHVADTGASSLSAALERTLRDKLLSLSLSRALYTDASARTAAQPGQSYSSPPNVGYGLRSDQAAAGSNAALDTETDNTASFGVSEHSDAVTVSPALLALLPSRIAKLRMLARFYALLLFAGDRGDAVSTSPGPNMATVAMDAETEDMVHGCPNASPSARLARSPIFPLSTTTTAPASYVPTAPPLDLCLLLRRAVQHGSLALQLPWLVELLSCASLRPAVLHTPYYSHVLSLLAAVYFDACRDSHALTASGVSPPLPAPHSVEPATTLSSPAADSASTAIARSTLVSAATAFASPLLSPGSVSGSVALAPLPMRDIASDFTAPSAATLSHWPAEDSPLLTATYSLLPPSADAVHTLPSSTRSVLGNARGGVPRSTSPPSPLLCARVRPLPRSPPAHPPRTLPPSLSPPSSSVSSLPPSAASPRTHARTVYSRVCAQLSSDADARVPLALGDLPLRVKTPAWENTDLEDSYQVTREVVQSHPLLPSPAPSPVAEPPGSTNVLSQASAPSPTSCPTPPLCHLTPPSPPFSVMPSCTSVTVPPSASHTPRPRGSSSSFRSPRSPSTPREAPVPHTLRTSRTPHLPWSATSTQPSTPHTTSRSWSRPRARGWLPTHVATAPEAGGGAVDIRSVFFSESTLAAMRRVDARAGAQSVVPLLVPVSVVLRCVPFLLRQLCRMAPGSARAAALRERVAWVKETALAHAADSPLISSRAPGGVTAATAVFRPTTSVPIATTTSPLPSCHSTPSTSQSASLPHILASTRSIVPRLAQPPPARLPLDAMLLSAGALQGLMPEVAAVILGRLLGAQAALHSVVIEDLFVSLGIPLLPVHMGSPSDDSAPTAAFVSTHVYSNAALTGPRTTVHLPVVISSVITPHAVDASCDENVRGVLPPDRGASSATLSTRKRARGDARTELLSHVDPVGPGTGAPVAAGVGVDIEGTLHNCGTFSLPQAPTAVGRAVTVAAVRVRPTVATFNPPSAPDFPSEEATTEDEFSQVDSNDAPSSLAFVDVAASHLRASRLSNAISPSQWSQSPAVSPPTTRAPRTPPSGVHGPSGAAFPVRGKCVSSQPAASSTSQLDRARTAVAALAHVHSQLARLQHAHPPAYRLSACALAAMDAPPLGNAQAPDAPRTPAASYHVNNPHPAGEQAHAPPAETFNMDILPLCPAPLQLLAGTSPICSLYDIDHCIQLVQRHAVSRLLCPEAEPSSSLRRCFAWHLAPAAPSMLRALASVPEALTTAAGIANAPQDSVADTSSPKLLRSSLSTYGTAVSGSVWAERAGATPIVATSPSAVHSSSPGMTRSQKGGNKSSSAANTPSVSSDNFPTLGSPPGKKSSGKTSDLGNVKPSKLKPRRVAPVAVSPSTDLGPCNIASVPDSADDNQDLFRPRERRTGKSITVDEPSDDSATSRCTGLFDSPLGGDSTLARPKRKIAPIGVWAAAAQASAAPTSAAETTAPPASLLALTPQSPSAASSAPLPSTAAIHKHPNATLAPLTGETAALEQATNLLPQHSATLVPSVRPLETAVSTDIAAAPSLIRPGAHITASTGVEAPPLSPTPTRAPAPVDAKEDIASRAVVVQVRMGSSSSRELMMALRLGVRTTVSLAELLPASDEASVMLDAQSTPDDLEIQVSLPQSYLSAGEKTLTVHSSVLNPPRPAHTRHWEACYNAIIALCERLRPLYAAPANSLPFPGGLTHAAAHGCTCSGSCSCPLAQSTQASQVQSKVVLPVFLRAMFASLLRVSNVPPCPHLFSFSRESHIRALDAFSGQVISSRPSAQELLLGLSGNSPLFREYLFASPEQRAQALHALLLQHPLLSASLPAAQQTLDQVTGELCVSVFAVQERYVSRCVHALKQTVMLLRTLLQSLIVVPDTTPSLGLDATAGLHSLPLDSTSTARLSAPLAALYTLDVDCLADGAQSARARKLQRLLQGDSATSVSVRPALALTADMCVAALLSSEHAWQSSTDTGTTSDEEIDVMSTTGVHSTSVLANVTAKSAEVARALVPTLLGHLVVLYNTHCFDATHAPFSDAPVHQHECEAHIGCDVPRTACALPAVLPLTFAPALPYLGSGAALALVVRPMRLLLTVQASMYSAAAVAAVSEAIRHQCYVHMRDVVGKLVESICVPRALTVYSTHVTAAAHLTAHLIALLQLRAADMIDKCIAETTAMELKSAFIAQVKPHYLSLMAPIDALLEQGLALPDILADKTLGDSSTGTQHSQSGLPRTEVQPEQLWSDMAARGVDVATRVLEWAPVVAGKVNPGSGTVHTHVHLTHDDCALNMPSVPPGRTDGDVLAFSHCRQLAQGCLILQEVVAAVHTAIATVLTVAAAPLHSELVCGVAGACSGNAEPHSTRIHSKLDTPRTAVGSSVCELPGNMRHTSQLLPHATPAALVVDARAQLLPFLCSMCEPHTHAGPTQPSSLSSSTHPRTPSAAPLESCRGTSATSPVCTPYASCHVSHSPLFADYSTCTTPGDSAIHSARLSASALFERHARLAATGLDTAYTDNLLAASADTAGHSAGTSPTTTPHEECPPFSPTSSDTSSAAHIANPSDPYAAFLDAIEDEADAARSQSAPTVPGDSIALPDTPTAHSVPVSEPSILPASASAPADVSLQYAVPCLAQLLAARAGHSVLHCSHAALTQVSCALKLAADLWLPHDLATNALDEQQRPDDVLDQKNLWGCFPVSLVAASIVAHSLAEHYVTQHAARSLGVDVASARSAATLHSARDAREPVPVEALSRALRLWAALVEGITLLPPSQPTLCSAFASLAHAIALAVSRVCPSALIVPLLPIDASSLTFLACEPPGAHPAEGGALSPCVQWLVHSSVWRRWHCGHMFGQLTASPMHMLTLCRDAIAAGVCGSARAVMREASLLEHSLHASRTITKLAVRMCTLTKPKYTEESANTPIVDTATSTALLLPLLTSVLDLAQVLWADVARVQVGCTGELVDLDVVDAVWVWSCAIIAVVDVLHVMPRSADVGDRVMCAVSAMNCCDVSGEFATYITDMLHMVVAALPLPVPNYLW